MYGCVSMFMYMCVFMCLRFTKAAVVSVAPIGSWPTPGTKEGSGVCGDCVRWSSEFVCMRMDVDVDVWQWSIPIWKH